MEGLIMAAQLILGLTILVGLHEFGHLLTAKAFGMRVEKYMINFPPKIWSFKYGETEYGIGMIPLGGFVKISGMIDESMDTKTLNEEPKDYEFRAKPAWQRLIVMLGGIIVNVITGVIIFISLIYINGESYIAKDEFNKHGVHAKALGKEVGLQDGDQILKVNGHDYDEFKDLINAEVLLSSGASYTVKRGDEVFEISIPADFLDKFADKKFKGKFFSVRKPYGVEQVITGSSAEKGGLKKGDEILSVNGISTKYFHELQNALSLAAGDTALTVIHRKGKIDSLTFAVSEQGIIGFRPAVFIDFSMREYTFVQSIGAGTSKAFGIVFDNIRGLSKIFKGEVSAKNALSGPIGIAQMFGPVWDWNKFWSLTGMLSMVLAFMNLLPIPALDGGHVVFLTYEMISGRKPNDKFLENAQKIGMILLLGLMVFAFYNDISKFFS